jgi:hypothetical protein
MKKRKQTFQKQHKKVKNPHSYHASASAITDFKQNWEFDIRDIDYVNPGGNEEETITQTSPVKISKMEFGRNEGEMGKRIFDGGFGVEKGKGREESTAIPGGWKSTRMKRDRKKKEIEENLFKVGIDDENKAKGRLKLTRFKE